MIGLIQRLKDSSLLGQGGVLMGFIVIVGTVSLLENVVAPVIRKMYNNGDGAESDSISLEDYLGN
jgi:hypothetical protein